MSERGWMPDGSGLDPISLKLVVERGAACHLRLAADGRYPIAACAIDEKGEVDRGGEVRTWGQLWTGKAAEVTCPNCLEVVHA